MFSPAQNVGLDPHSEEYFQKLVAALDLDTDISDHVNLIIMKQFKELIRKYSHAFYLQGSQLVQFKSYHHHIATGDFPVAIWWYITYLIGKVLLNWQQ